MKKPKNILFINILSIYGYFFILNTILAIILLIWFGQLELFYYVIHKYIDFINFSAIFSMIIIILSFSENIYNKRNPNTGVEIEIKNYKLYKLIQIFGVIFSLIPIIYILISFIKI